MQTNKYYKVPTPIGHIWVTPQGQRDDMGGGYVLYCRCEHDAQIDFHRWVESGALLDDTYHEHPAQGQDHTYVRPIRIRGVEHRGTFHAYQWSDNTYNTCSEWSTDSNYRPIEPRRKASPWDMRRQLYLYRITGQTFDNDASEAAKNTFIEKVMPSITKWASGHQDLLMESYRDQLETKIAATREEMTKTRAEYEAKLEALETKLEQLSFASSKVAK